MTDQRKAFDEWWTHDFNLYRKEGETAEDYEYRVVNKTFSAGWELALSSQKSELVGYCREYVVDYLAKGFSITIDPNKKHDKDIPLYTSPPQSKALVAAAFRLAADACEKYASEVWGKYKNSPVSSPDRGDPHLQGVSDGAENCVAKILSLTPADAEQKLKDMLIRMGKEVRDREENYILGKADSKYSDDADLEAIADKLIKGE